MTGLIRTKVADAVGETYADGADLMAGLLAMPSRRSEPQTLALAPEPAPSPDAGLFTSLLAKPRGERAEVESRPVTPWVAPSPTLDPAPVAPVPMPPAPAIVAKPGRVLRTRATVVSEVERQLIHGEFDQLLAESVAAMPANMRLGKCRVCGAAKGVCRIGPFWGD